MIIIIFFFCLDFGSIPIALGFKSSERLAGLTDSGAVLCMTSSTADTAAFEVEPKAACRCVRGCLCAIILNFTVTAKLKPEQMLVSTLSLWQKKPNMRYETLRDIQEKLLISFYSLETPHIQTESRNRIFKNISL